jgi:tetratricopeptide (TPR) repeat protein
MRKQSFLGKETGMIKHKRMHWVMAGLVGLPLVGAVSRTQAAEKKFTLTRMVPADVFVCVSARGNPERAFVMDYWGEIFTAAKNSGIGDDLMAMIKEAVGEGDQLDEMNRMKARAMELFNGVDWSALGDGEMVFAERLPPATNQGGNINMGPPDILLIFRGEHAEKNYQGFVNMLTAAVEEISKASQSDYLKLRHETRAGAKIATVDLLTTEQQGLRYNLALAQRDDLIIATIGDRMLDQVLGLIGGESSIANLADSPRFQTAFKQLPAAEDTATFFDMQGMLKPFRQLLGFAVKEMGGAEDVVINARDAGKAFELNAEAVRAYREKDHTRALELVKQAVEADPTDSRVLYNLACFNAVNGNKDAALAALQKSVDAGFYAPALIAKDGDLASLREAPAYQQALAKAKSEVESRGGNEGQIVDRVANRLIDVPGMIDYIATVEYTEGFSLHSKTVVAAVPGVEKNPFYSVVTAKPKFKSYDQFLPQETESFAVSGGVDLVAFYKFVEDTFKLAGPDGERAWSQWVNFQKEADFDIHKNVLDWIGGDMVSVTLEKSQGSVLMIQVKDAEVAKAKMSAAVEFLSTKLVEAASQNPALGMLSVRKSPVQHDKLEGFENLFFGMSPQPVVWGVAGGHLIFADKADAIVACLETAQGKHPGIAKNDRVMKEALVPDGEFVSVMLTDYRMLGQQLAGVIGMFSMMGGMATMGIPDPEARQILSKVLGMMMKLTPVVSKIDFYKSSASVTTFDGKAWHVHAVTHYKSPLERAAAQQ